MAEAHHGLGLLAAQPLDFRHGRPAQHDLFPTQEVLELCIERRLAANTRGKHSSDREQDHVLKLNSSGDELLLMFVPGQALQVDSGEQHSKRDVIMMQHSLSDSVKRHLNRKPSA